MAYKVRKFFHLYDDWLFQWGFPEGRGLVQSDYLTPRGEHDLSLFYDYQRHLQETTEVKLCLCSRNKLDCLLLT